MSSNKSVYPELTTPVSKSDLESTYSLFNKLYFNNELPKCRLKFAPLAKNFYGKYHHVYGTSGAKDRLITLASILVNDVKELCDTLLHEMIHCWQYMMQEKTNNSDYIDEPWFDFEKDKHKKGHGPHFHSHLNRLNKLGFNISVEGDPQIDKELGFEAYVIVFAVPSDNCVFLWSMNDPKPKLNDIIAEVEKFTGKAQIKNCTIYKSKDTSTNIGLRLTKTFELPKNSKNIYFNHNAVLNIFSKSALTSVYYTTDLKTVASNVDMDGVTAEEVKLANSIVRVRGKDSFSEYLSVILDNSSRFKNKHHGKINWRWTLDDDKFVYGKKIKNIPDGLIKFAYEVWSNISDVDVKSSFKFSTRSIFILCEKIVNGKPVSESDYREFDKFKSTYISNFKERVPEDKYLDLFTRTMKTEFKAFAKKYPSLYKDVTDKPIIDQFYKLYKERKVNENNIGGSMTTATRVAKFFSLEESKPKREMTEANKKLYDAAEKVFNAISAIKKDVKKLKNVAVDSEDKNLIDDIYDLLDEDVTSALTELMMGSDPDMDESKRDINIRDEYYEASDKIGALKQSLKKSNERDLIKEFEKVDESFKKFSSVLNKNYNWD